MRLVIGSSDLNEGGGILTYVRGISKYLTENGHNVLICSTSYNPQIHTTENIYESFIYDSKINEIDEISRLLKVIEEFNPDAVINNDNIYISGLLPCFHPRIVRISVVHGYREYIGWDPHKIINKAATYNNEYIDWIITISDHMLKGMQKDKRLSNDQLRMIYNGLNPSVNTLIDKQIRKSSKIRTFIFAGGAKKEKGGLTLLNALRYSINRIPNIKVYWVGNIPCTGKVSSKSLSKFNNLDVLGFISNNELLQILGQSHFLIMPSLAEGCPMLLLEAMSLGVVPIVSDCPSAMIEIIEKSKSGFAIKTKDYKSLSSTIELVSNENFNWEIQSNNCYEYFQNNLRIQHLCDSLIDLCKQIRQTRNKNLKKFPPKGLVSFHRRSYHGNKLNISNIFLRIGYLLGKLSKIS